MRTAVIVSVAVEQTAFNYDKPFDYLLPYDMQQAGKPGCRVMVPFGRSNKKRQGMILSVGETSDYDKLKPVAGVLDSEPVLSAEMLALVGWIREHTFCTYYDAVKLMLPAGINMRIIASYRASERATAEQLPDDLSDEEKRTLDFLISSRATVERSRLLDALSLGADSKVPDALVNRGLLERTDDAVRRMGDATVRMVRLAEDADIGRLTPKQKAVVDLVSEVGAATVKEVCYFAGVTQAVITALAKKGVLDCYDSVVYRTGGATRPADDTKIVLADEQQQAFDGLKQLYESGEGAAALLYGVTGSGKTQVFLKLVDEAVASGRGAIVMVPEISLTPQTLDVFDRRYGGRVAVFHSAMSMGQRLDEWKRVKNGDADVAVGTRSAVFAPFENLGLIIMDEEQEHTYKSESTPRFNARDAARFRAAYGKGLLLLASATPSVETFAAAKSGRYKLFRLTKRYGNAHLPTVHTVDMRKELSDGNSSPFSRFLKLRLGEALEAGHQSILLLNRRGHNTVVTCSSCGHVMTCPNCSISLTYHSANRRLMCHYCGYSEEFTSKCPECGNEHIRYSGVGTQRAEQELGELFPSAKVLRMDADSTLARNSYEDKLSAFARGEYDIMLGTQMVAKGLNFPNVTLVGVLNADSSLYSEDYRSCERTFSLLTQVVGRSGRGDEKGIAVVQTVTPENEIITLAAEQDYDKFYEQEIMTRRVMIYPPYCSLCLVGFIADTSEQAREGSVRFLDMLKKASEPADGRDEVRMIVLGPSPAVVPRVSGKYRYRVMIKVKNNRPFREMLMRVLKAFMSDKANKNITAFADMNPETTF